MGLSRLARSVALAALPILVASAAQAYVAPRRSAVQHQHRGHGLVALVGDRGSGLGFYALPPQFRRHGPAYSRQGSAIRYAVATEAGTSDFYSVGGDPYRERHGRTLFNPADGYGTPFFAGYYGPAGDPDAERGPFGQPYN